MKRILRNKVKKFTFFSTQQTVIGGTVGGAYSAYDNIGKKKASRDELTTKILEKRPEVPVRRKPEILRQN